MSSKTHESSEEKIESAPKSQSKSIIILLVVLAFSVLFMAATAFTFLKDRQLTINDQKFDVVLADTPPEREKGLSGWDRLGQDQGMLFVYSEPGPYCIWMKDMKFSIDIIWFDASRKVIHTEQNVPPESYPDTFCPESNAKYILEVPAGTVSNHQIKAGDQAKF